MMKKVMIVANFVMFPWEEGDGRFTYLADLICKESWSVELVTSDFIHGMKRHRILSDDRIENGAYKITLLHEPGYPKNVCLKRLYSHKKFAENLRAYLKNCPTPDIIYCAIPSPDVGVVCAEYCKNNGIKFIIDIQDLWPEAFKMVFDLSVVSNIVFSPMNKKADKIYAAADHIIAVSRTYADRGLSVNKKGIESSVIYLGTDKAVFDSYANIDRVNVGTLSEQVKLLIKQLAAEDKSKIRLVYCGTLGHSYDLPCVFNAMRKLEKSVLDKLEFVIMGDGPKRNEFERSSSGLPVVFVGSLPYEIMVWILVRCNIAICPIVKGAAQSIINKHMDYAMAGLPVINTQECEEYRNLIDLYDCGVNCECGNACDVADAINLLINNAEKLKEMGGNSRRMGEELFDRQKTYPTIKDIIRNFL